MTKIVNIETHNKTKPIILLCGNKNPIVNTLVNNYLPEFKILNLVFGESELDIKNSDYYEIKSHSFHLIEKLEEKIDYAIIFFQNIIDKNSLQHILNKLEQDSTRSLIIIPISKVDYFSDIIEKLTKEKNVFILLLGELYGNSIPDDFSFLSKIIHNVFINKSVTLSGNDLLPIFPISDIDTIKTINDLIFGTQKNHRYFYLFYDYPQTLISAVHLLKRVEPELEIKFIDEGIHNQQYYSSEKIVNDFNNKFGAEVKQIKIGLLGFEKSLANIDFINIKKEKILGEKPISKSSKKIEKNNLFFPIINALGLIFLINLFSLCLGLLLAKNCVDSFNKGSIENLKPKATLSLLLLNLSDPSASLLTNFYSLVKNDETNTKIGLTKNNLNIFISTINTIEGIQKTQEGISSNEFQKIISNFVSLYSSAQYLKLENSDKTLKKFVNEDYSKLVSIIQVSPEIFGFTKEKKYLILFQDDQELRPDGGIISAVGEIQFLKGKVTNFSIKDTESLDANLNAHVEPNIIIRKYLKPHLYLKDSSFELDFQKSASFSALLYNLETKEKVDGVIAINFKVLKSILKVSGPVKLSSINKTVDENNVYSFLQNNISSSNGVSVLEEIFKQIKIDFTKHPNHTYRLTTLIPEMLKRKDIFFSFRDASVQGIFSANGFSGNIEDLREKEQGGIYDIFSFNEANIGLNKANADIKRSIDYDAYLENTEIVSKVSIKFKNSGEKELDYKYYLRFITPLGSQLIFIKINGVDQKIIPAVIDPKIFESKKYVAKNLEIYTATESANQVFGFTNQVNSKESQNIEISYKNGLNPFYSPLTTYSLLFIKQPGIPTFPLNVKLHYNNFIPQDISKASFEKNALLISDNVDFDKEYKITLLKEK